MSKWDMSIVRKLAGLPAEEPKQLSESWEDDDDVGGDEDPDARIASEDKAQRKFEKRNKKELKAADKGAKELSTKKPAEAKKAEPKKEEPKKAEPKKEQPKKAEPAKAEPAKAEPKAEKKSSGGETTFVHGKGFVSKEEAEKAKSEPKAETPKKDAAADAEAKKRGKAPNPDGKQGKAREWLASNSHLPRNERRKAFMAHMTGTHGMSKHHASSFYAKHSPASAEKVKQEVKELYYIQHPYMPSYALSENQQMSTFNWTDVMDVEPIYYETLAEAEKMAKYMSEWKGQATVVECVKFDDEQGD